MSKKNAVTYDEVFKYLSDKKRRYANECTESRKRAIRKFSENIRLEDGVLFYVQYDDEEKQSVKSKRQWISDEKKNRSKYCSLYMMILLVGATLDETRQEIKFPVDISGMGSVMMLMSTSGPVTSVRRYGFIHSLYF